MTRTGKIFTWTFFEYTAKLLVKFSVIFRFVFRHIF